MYKNSKLVYKDKELSIITSDIIEGYIDVPLDSHFIPLYDSNGKKLNVILVCRPFEQDNQYKIFCANRHDHIILGISSYQEFPGIPENPNDGWKLPTNSSGNQYYLNMYRTMFDGWLHCFKDPTKYFDTSKPHALISESDFVRYDGHIPKEENKKYDFVYVCTRTDWSLKNPDESSCWDWTAQNKNWELAKKCLPILCGSKESGGMNLKGILVGRKGCDMPEGVEKNLELTLHKDYNELMKVFDQSKFIFIPNLHDASPRIITEAMCYNCAVLINTNIVGGWKYATEETGKLFNDETDIKEVLESFWPKVEKGEYKPRQHIIENYGPINSGKKLKKFLMDNFKEKLKYEKEFEYVHYPRWKP